MASEVVATMSSFFVSIYLSVWKSIPFFQVLEKGKTIKALDCEDKAETRTPTRRRKDPRKKGTERVCVCMCVRGTALLSENKAEEGNARQGRVGQG